MKRGITVTVPVELHARLKSEAERRRMTLPKVIEQALESLVTGPAAPPVAGPDAGEESGFRPIWEEIEEVMSQVPEADLAALPTDLAEQHDHYLYGTPKR